VDLPQIAFQDGWRDLVSPSLTAYLYQFESQGIVFSWSFSPECTYIFSASLQLSGNEAVMLCSWDGTEMPRHAINEVIIGTMSARGRFGSLNQKQAPPLTPKPSEQ
jgi:hypothetical protein